MRAKLIGWFGVALSLGLVTFIALRFDLRGAFEAISLAKPRWLVAGAAAYLLLFKVRALRLSFLVRDIKPVPVRVTTDVVLVGFLVNNVTPARLGELARAWLLGTRGGAPFGTAFSIVILDRLFDGAAALGFLFIVLAVAPPEAQWVKALAIPIGGIFLVVIGAAALITWNTERALALASRLLRPLPARIASSVEKQLVRLAVGLQPLRNPKAMARVALLTLVIWSGEVLVYALVQQAFGMSIPVLGLVLVTTVLAFGLSAPSAPAFVGVYEGVLIAAVMLYGVTDPIAPAFAITMHLVHAGPGSVWGLFCAWRSSFRIRDLRLAADSLTQRSEDFEDAPHEAPGYGDRGARPSGGGASGFFGT